MKAKLIVFCMFLFACSGETFTQKLPTTSILPPDSSDPFPFKDATDQDSLSDGPTEALGWEGGIDSPPALCPNANDVEYNNHCYYLDGSKGICDSGYTLSSNTRLASILLANANSWQGKSYRYQISDNACVLTKDNVQNFGMVTHANQPGPFSAGEPKWNGSSCMGVYFMTPKQLTLCESL